MKAAPFAALAVAFAVTLIWTPAVKADEIEVLFSGVITATDGPGLFIGETFTGGISYSTADPLAAMVLGGSEYSMTSAEDSVFVSIGGLNLSLPQPLTDVIAFVDPSSEFFDVQDFGTSSSPVISGGFAGNSNFLTSGALPETFNAEDVIAGGIGVDFAEDDVTYFAEGNITGVSVAPEPRGLGLVCCAMLGAVLLFRRPFKASRS
jgi:hypothetical protein